MNVVLEKKAAKRLIDEPVVIETDLSAEEHAFIAEGVARYHEHPEDFVSLDSLKR